MDRRSPGLGWPLALVVFAAGLCSTGCAQNAVTNGAVSQLPNTPEDHLKNVMRRLEHALAQARPPADTGIRSERRCSYRFVEPSSESEPYTAEVTIVTSIELDADAVADNGKNGKKRPAAKTQPIDEASAELAEAVASEERDVFQLRYQDQRWELADPPFEELPETLQACFQHALSDG